MADKEAKRRKRSRSYSSDKESERKPRSSSKSSSRTKKLREPRKKSRSRSRSVSTSSNPEHERKSRRKRRTRSSISASSSSGERKSKQKKRVKSLSSRRKSRSCSRSGLSSSSRSSSSSSSSSDSEYERKKAKKSKHKTTKKKKKRKKMKKRKKSTHAVNQNKYGKYGILSEADQFTKQPEFYCWLQEARQLNPETLPRSETRKMFETFMEDYNTATLPHKKYYNLVKWEMKYNAKKRLKEIKKAKKNSISFADDESKHTMKFKGEEKRYGLSKERILEMKRAIQERTEQEYKKNVGFEQAARK